MMSSEKINLLGLNQQALQLFFEKIGETRFRATQLLKWVHHHGICDFEVMTDLGKTLRAKLLDIAKIEAPAVAVDRVSDDGTRKWLLQLGDGNSIETVFIPDGDRGTLCISSQVGCVLNCSFCSTGKQGFSRNLTAAEIIGQVWNAARILGGSHKTKPVITNVVLMGMGEPLLNFENVCLVLDILLHPFGYGLSKRRVTVSTAGVVPMMEQLKVKSPVALAVSLHAPNNTLRNQLVPLNKKYPLEQLIPLCKSYYAKDSRQSVTYEYVMLEDINDSREHARELVHLLAGSPCKVNLIPFNPFPYSEYRCSSSGAILQFQSVLMKAGIRTMIRRTRGNEIDAACGQLVGKVSDRTSRSARWQKEKGVYREEPRCHA